MALSLPAAGAFFLLEEVPPLEAPAFPATALALAGAAAAGGTGRSKLRTWYGSMRLETPPQAPQTTDVSVLPWKVREMKSDWGNRGRCAGSRRCSGSDACWPTELDPAIGVAVGGWA